MFGCPAKRLLDRLKAQDLFQVSNSYLSMFKYFELYWF